MGVQILTSPTGCVSSGGGCGEPYSSGTQLHHHHFHCHTPPQPPHSQLEHPNQCLSWVRTHTRVLKTCAKVGDNEASYAIVFKDTLNMIRTISMMYLEKQIISIALQKVQSGIKTFSKQLKMSIWLLYPHILKRTLHIMCQFM